MAVLWRSFVFSEFQYPWQPLTFNMNIMKDNNLTFFQRRMNLLGVTSENNKIWISNPEAEPPAPRRKEIPIFQEDKDGNIQINYWTIEGEHIVYYNDNKTPQPRFYCTRRLQHPQGDRKYLMPKGQGTFPWFHPMIVEKYQKSERIDTIYLTEGVFKAWKACEVGLHVIGLSSITHYRDSTGQLYHDIQRLIERCQVENVVILWDGDCLDISKHGVSKREDLTTRPENFFRQVKAIRRHVHKIDYDKPRDKPNVHFMHVKSNIYEDKPKGLDDLLIAAESRGQLQAAVQDATMLRKNGPFFYKADISSTTDRLYNYFGLHDVEVFYKMHAERIGENDFFFHENHYYYDDKKNSLTLIAPAWAKELRWIGDEFFMIVTEPSARGDRKVLKKYSKETLRDLYGRDFIKYLKHFAGFCNVPSHFSYEQVIERNNKQFYNRYFPFRHDIEPGDYQVIIDFFKHIFGTHLAKNALTGEEIPNYELGLDYIQLMLTKPTQQLPVICLYSKENATGKSTFGKLMQYLFGDNCVQIGNADLQSDFNETYADKILAICEETLLERKRDAERVKALSTSNQVLVNPKGQRQYAIDFFCKFWFFSNNIRMIYLTKHDERYWVMTVPKPTDQDPSLEERMYAQVPAFIHFLKTRQLRTQRQSRMWFHNSLMRTDTLEDFVKVNEPADATELREGIKELFLQNDESIDTIEIPLKELRNLFFSPSTNTRWIQEILSDYLEVDLLRDSKGAAIFKRGQFYRQIWMEEFQDFRLDTVKWRGRPYVFKRVQFVTQGEVYIESNDSGGEIVKEEDFPW